MPLRIPGRTMRWLESTFSFPKSALTRLATISSPTTPVTPAEWPSTESIANAFPTDPPPEVPRYSIDPTLATLLPVRNMWSTATSPAPKTVAKLWPPCKDGHTLDFGSARCNFV